jgi:pyruvate formate lyase activating enzyme
LGARDAVELVRTIEMLKTGKAEYEFRTTVVPGFVGEEDIAEISELVKGTKNFALQQFVPGDALDKELNSLKPYTLDSIAVIAERMKPFAENVTIRA